MKHTGSPNYLLACLAMPTDAPSTAAAKGGRSAFAGRAATAVAVLVAVAVAALSAGAGGVIPGQLDEASAATCKNFRLGARSLKMGHCGEDVRALNWFLDARKFEVGLNGNFQDRTDTAVRQFQSATNLNSDGVVGPQTVEKIRSRMSGGKASWYGPGLWGNRTACGQKLKKNTIGVAVPVKKIKKFPCGTRVLLNHGGRWMRAKVIDTGGFAKYGRKWDLTRRTAKRLNPDFKAEGVFTVRAITGKP